MKMLDVNLNEKGKLKWGDSEELLMCGSYAHHMYVKMPQRGLESDWHEEWVMGLCNDIVKYEMLD
jgi:hypothetical protein